ncbi:hypothetical protein ZIOFF_041363 [Zingiber officinale]|uniref:Uncharacterized protein n=1 Tax=Zingiber officinale TaxID=94328 RepID=A0A8J5GIM1_ZINOF|nr:hypothetical protein ZIOFF_041363 [Zingiber officinale]
MLLVMTLSKEIRSLFWMSGMAGSIGEVPILLVKPQSYMNYSGESVGPLAAYYQVPLRHILLILRMPPEAVDLVSRLLQYSPNLRCTAVMSLAIP